MPMTLRYEIFPADMDRAVDFYTSVLAFSVNLDRRPAQPYVSLRRDGVVIGVSSTPGDVHRDCRQPPTGIEVVLEVDDLDAEFESVQQAGGVVVEGINRQVWGLRDFRICDPDGYYLRLTEREGD